MDFKIFLIRISICFILSLLIGLERQYRHRMVGLRTNVLVSLGAFMFMVVTYGINTNDESRIAAQVVSGIGFLGAGVILRDGSKIKGLNTAATLWCVAAVGVLTSAGMLKEACVGTLFVLLSNIVLRILSLKIMDYVKLNQMELCIIRIECDKDGENNVRRDLYTFLDSKNLTLQSLEKNEITKELVKLKAIITTSQPTKVEGVVNLLGSNVNVSSIKWEHINYRTIDTEDTEESIDD